MNIKITFFGIYIFKKFNIEQQEESAKIAFSAKKEQKSFKVFVGYTCEGGKPSVSITNFFCSTFV